MYALVLLPEWECSACTPEKKVYRGCDAPSRAKVEFNGEAIDRCPRRPLLDDPTLYDELFWLFHNYKLGMLPEGGGLNSNPNKLVQMLRILHNAEAQATSERDAKERKKLAQRNATQVAPSA